MLPDIISRGIKLEKLENKVKRDQRQENLKNIQLVDDHYNSEG